MTARSIHFVRARVRLAWMVRDGMAVERALGEAARLPGLSPDEVTAISEGTRYMDESGVIRLTAKGRSMTGLPDPEELVRRHSFPGETGTFADSPEDVGSHGAVGAEKE